MQKRNNLIFDCPMTVLDTMYLCPWYYFRPRDNGTSLFSTADTKAMIITSRTCNHHSSFYPTVVVADLHALFSTVYVLSKCESMVTPPTDLWTTVLKPGVWHGWFLQPGHAQYWWEHGTGGWCTGTWPMLGFGPSVHQEMMAGGLVICFIYYK